MAIHLALNVGLAWEGGRRPFARLESGDVFAQGVEIHVPDEDFLLEDGIVDPGLFELLLRETDENHVVGVDQRTEAGELADLFEAQVGLDVVLEGLYQLGDARQHFGLGQFLAQGAQDLILAVGALEDALLAQARQPERLVAVEVIPALGQDHALRLGRVGGQETERFGQVDIDAIHGVDDLLEGAHVDRGIVIHLRAEVERQRARHQAWTLGGIVGVAEARVAVQVGLVEPFVILAAEVVGDVGNLHPQVAWKFEHGDLRGDEIDAHQADDVAQAVGVAVAALVRADQ